MGTSGGGLNRFDPRNGKFKIYKHDFSDPVSLSDDIVYCLLVDHKGELWAGTEHGLNRFDPKLGVFARYLIEGADRASFRAITEDSTGALWLSTLSSGVHRFDPATGVQTVYGHNADSGSIMMDWVNMTRIDHRGIAWLATSNGLERLDPASGRANIYYERDGLPSNNLIGVLEDERENIWISTNNGLSQLNPRTGRFRNYYVSDGLISNEFYRRNCAWKSPRGEMFFCTSMGLTAFFPKHIVEQAYVPPVILTDFLLADKPVAIGGPSPLKESISVTRSLRLKPGQDIFTIEFASLSYADSRRNRYRYRLEPLETDWNERDSSHRTATYTTLPPGTYTFRVQGSNNRGAWNEAGATIRILIMPPWWQTWWFRSCSATVLLGALWYLHRLRLAQIERQLNLRYEERLAERTRIAQDLHDTLLQGILSASMQLHAAADCVPVDSPLKQPLSRVLELIQGGIVEGRDAVQGLRLNPQDCLELERAFSQIPLELATEQKMGFSMVVKGSPKPLHPIVRDEVYRIGREAAINAIRHSGAQTIAMEMEYGRDHLTLVVRDDGCGMEATVIESGRAGHWDFRV